MQEMNDGFFKANRTYSSYDYLPDAVIMEIGLAKSIIIINYIVICYLLLLVFTIQYQVLICGQILKLEMGKMISLLY